MNYITADAISLSRGGKELLKNVSFSIEDTSCVAIVGLNGCGKSSLLYELARGKSLSGKVTKNSDCTIHFMEQLATYDPNETLLDYVFSSFTLPHIKTIKEYECAINSIDESWNESKQERLDQISTEMERLGAWEFEGRLKALLNQFGVTNLNEKMGGLSGGMIRKLSLAQAILSEADLLILDEPTNHLDIDTVLWLQEYLAKRNRAFILVTHDRYFLDNVCNTIWEIDQQTLYTYKGNFTYYLEKKEEREEAERKKVEKINSLLRTEIEWLRRSPSARGTKQKARIDRVHEMMKVGGIKEQSTAKMSSSGRKLGKKVVNIKNVGFSYGNKEIIKEFSYNFKQNEKIGLIGGNGVGKTTLLNLITGKLQEQSGYIDRGLNTDFGYFSQTSQDMPLEMPILKYLKTFAEVIELNGEVFTAGKLLEQFLFPLNSHFRKINELSGGERRRLQLLTVLIKNPNFLILDEPTNDLDIQTLAILEDFLIKFSGALIVVSHDRFFLDKVCDYLLVMDGNANLFGFPSNYSDYLVWKKEKQREQKSQKRELKVETVKKETPKTKLSFNEKRELEALEAEVDDLEVRKEELEALFQTTTGSDVVVLNEEYSQVSAQLTQKMERWEYLSTIGEGA